MKGCAIFIIFISFVLSTCKKYDDGGLIRLTRKHLFGGHEVGDSKTWKLKRYEVNGIDSTYLIPGANTIPDFYDKFIKFKLIDRRLCDFYAHTGLYAYAGKINLNEKKLLIGMMIGLTKQDSVQCASIGGNTYCHRNIFYPEVESNTHSWTINKLTDKILIVSAQLKNSYKIILSQ